MRSPLFALVLCAAFCLTGIPVRAGDDGMESYRAGVAKAAVGRYTDAVVDYRQAASVGHAGAQRDLGIMHDFGAGVHRDYAEAAVWYEKAADNGDPIAMLLLAGMYDSGRGVFAYSRPADLLRAKLLRMMRSETTADPWRLASAVGQDYAGLAETIMNRAKLGDAEARYSYGVMLETGLGVPRDVDKAAEFYAEAAVAGYSQAQARMGQLCQQGLFGVGRDDRQAFDWFGKAAEQRHPSALLSYGMYHYLLKNYDRAFQYYHAASMTGSVIATERIATLLLGEQKLDGAAEYSLKGARMGGANAHLFLFFLYEAGMGGLEADWEKAAAHLLKGFAMGSTGLPPDEMLAPYLGPRGRLIDSVAAFERYARLAEDDDPAGLILAGICRQHGLGAKRDPQKALEHFEQASGKGVAGAAFLVGKLYDTELFFAERRASCLDWYRKAADAGYGLASYRLGVLHQEGDLVEKSVEKAIRHFESVELERGVAALDSAERLHTLERYLTTLAVGEIAGMGE